MSDLVIHVRKIYFDQIKSGEKTEEYRKYSKYWLKRLRDGSGRDRIFDQILIACGYPSKSDHEKWLSFPMDEIVVKKVISPEFGKRPVQVFAISLKKEPDLIIASKEWKENSQPIEQVHAVIKEQGEPIHKVLLGRPLPSQDFVQLGAFDKPGAQ